MRITLSWLLNHLNINHTYESLNLIINAFNKLGIEVDEVKLYDMILVGKVILVSTIPKSSLSKCIIDISELNLPMLLQQFTILTKWPLTTFEEFKQEQVYTSFVPPENKTPEGLLISKRMMMGEESQGMLYTLRGEIANELYDIKPITYNAPKILKFDAVIKLSVNTNRPDLQCIRGLARDLSILVGKLKPMNYNTEYKNISSIMEKLNIKTLQEFVDLDIGINQYYGDSEIEGYKNSINNKNINIQYHNIYSENTNVNIFLSHSLFYKMTNMNLSLQQISEILNKAHFKCEIIREKIENTVHDEFGINVTAPIWRKDIEYNMYLIQEIIRIYELKSIPNNLTYSSYKLLKNKYDYIKNGLLYEGFTELYNYPFVNQVLNESTAIKITNMNAYMRDSLLYSLLESANNIMNYNEINAKLYEIGTIYKEINNQTIEQEKIGILVVGHEIANIMHAKYEITELYLQNILNKLNIDIKCDKCNLKLEENYYGCDCNYITTDVIKLGHNTYRYYYFEGDLVLQNYKNTFTNSMDKKYTNININSDMPIIWYNISIHLKNIEYRLISNGFFRNKYRITFTVTYHNIDEYNNIINKLKTISNIEIE